MTIEKAKKHLLLHNDFVRKRVADEYFPFLKDAITQNNWTAHRVSFSLKLLLTLAFIERVVEQLACKAIIDCYIYLIGSYSS